MRTTARVLPTYDYGPTLLRFEAYIVTRNTHSVDQHIPLSQRHIAFLAAFLIGLLYPFPPAIPCRITFAFCSEFAGILQAQLRL
jgi:hypothetical protein